MWNVFKNNNKSLERRHWRCSGAFIVNFEQISYIFSWSEYSDSLRNILQTRKVQMHFAFQVKMRFGIALIGQ